MNETSMNDATNWRSGKGHRDENFPVASFLIHPRHRGPILAFYNFVRTADDIADHATLAPEEKLDLLDRLGCGPPRREQRRRGGGAFARRRSPNARLSPRHAQDLLAAFKLDVTKLRYRDWDDLIGYCSLSAMPVGRFVLDVHGESRSTWPANDALCAALQIINHLQDCQGRLPQSRPGLCSARSSHRARHRGRSARRTAGLAAAAWRHCTASPSARSSFSSESDVFPLLINDRRLALEVSVINTLAHRITRMLKARDPLRDRVHLSKPAIAGLTLAGVISGAFRRLGGRRAPSRRKRHGVRE